MYKTFRKWLSFVSHSLLFFAPNMKIHCRNPEGRTCQGCVDCMDDEASSGGSTLQHMIIFWTKERTRTHTRRLKAEKTVLQLRHFVAASSGTCAIAMTTTMGCRDIISIQQGLVTLVRLYFQVTCNSIVTDMQMEKTISSKRGTQKTCWQGQSPEIQRSSKAEEAENLTFKVRWLTQCCFSSWVTARARMETQSTIEPFRCCTPALVTTVLVDVEVLPGPSFPTISDSCLQQQCHHHIHHKILLYKPIKGSCGGGGLFWKD
jgi:hypothetical protein